MKRSSTLNVAEEMKIKATVHYYYTPIKMSIETLKIPNADENVKQQEPSFFAAENAKVVHRVWIDSNFLLACKTAIFENRWPTRVTNQKVFCQQRSI